MERKWLLTLAVTLIFSSCQGQEKKLEDNKLNDAKNAPKEDIVVNKKYDKDGNLIEYDSTYTYFYSNIKNDTIAKDSIFKNFRKMFDAQYPFSHNPYFNDLFFQDSLLKYDFYKEDFFSERFRKNIKHAEKIFHEMDSIKNEFFKKQFPKN